MVKVRHPNAETTGMTAEPLADARPLLPRQFAPAHALFWDLPVSRPAIIMPAWNEAGCIADTLAEIRAHLPGIPVIVVDDGSTDTTAAVAADAGALVVRLPFNLGIGGALRAGFLFAVQHGFDAVVQVDADGQHRAEDVIRLLQGLDGADLVLGARFGHGQEYVVSGLRRLVMRLLARRMSSLAGVQLNDVTSGQRAIGPDLLAHVARHYPSEYLENVDALATALRLGYRVAERPVTMRQRTVGTPSHSPLKSVPYLARALFVLAMGPLRALPRDAQRRERGVS